MTDRMQPETRKAVTTLGGHARAAALTAGRRSDIARQANAASKSPAALARGIVKAWPQLDEAERAEVQMILREVIGNALSKMSPR